MSSSFSNKKLRILSKFEQKNGTETDFRNENFDHFWDLRQFPASGKQNGSKKSIAWPTSDLVKDNICTSVSLEHKWTLKGLIRF